MAQSVLDMQATHFWIAIVIACSLGIFGLIWGRKGFYLARLFEDVPTSKIRSAHQGYIELVGVADVLPGEPILAPLTNVSCCWYRYRIEKYDDKSWKTIQSGVSDGLFLIKDETGSSVVDPEKAEVTVAKTEKWTGDTLMPMVVNGNIVRNTFGFTGNYRYVESVLLPGQKLYAIGEFKTLDDIDHLQNRKELKAAILRDWKSNPETMKARFDHDRNGVVDVNEWQTAVDVAERQANQQYMEQLQSMHLNLMKKPDDGKPFVLSFVPQDGLIEKYRWKGIAGLGGFFLGGSIMTYMLSVRFF